MLEDKLLNYRILLGSGSPRRRELLAGCGLTFEVVRYEVEERYPASMPAEEVAPFLAQLKSDGYPNMLADNEILITADTVVVLDGRVLGKPVDDADARLMLRELSGRRHTVISGVVLRSGGEQAGFTDAGGQRSAGRQRAFTASTDVWFRKLTDEEIEWYIAEYQPLDKAGAYGVQEWLGYAAVERIEGSFYNVMGLPIAQLYTELEKFVNG